MRLLRTVVSVAAATAVLAADNLPTVVWHGLGDSADSQGIVSLLDLLSNHTFSPAFAISTGPRDSSFLGNINTQLATVCETLKLNPALQNGFNGIGFSQGGQFLRAYVQRCNDPPMRNLMTWGSQHSGIVEVPCGGGSGNSGGIENSGHDVGSIEMAAIDGESSLCRTTRLIVRNNAFSSFVQNRFVPAQYYKGFDLEAYLAGSIFLADINNERGAKNESYGAQMASLDHFLMIMFRDDLTVIPKESSLFADVDAAGLVTPVQNTTYFRDNRLGLDVLDARGALVSKIVEGAHMQIDEDDLLRFVDEYFLGKRQKESEETADRLRPGL